MSTPVRLALFVAALGAVFALAVGVGALAGPVGPAVADEPMSGHEADADADEGHGGAAAVADVPKGLQTAQDGYSLLLDRPSLPAGETELAFRVLGPDGQPLTAYETSHDEDLHLILAPGQPIHYGNHSCDPTLWHADAYTLVARRDLAAGEELTVDYATQTAESDFRMRCHCGAQTCRGLVTGDDWRSPRWQHRYGEHVVPAVARLIAGSPRSRRS